MRENIQLLDFCSVIKPQNSSRNHCLFIFQPYLEQKVFTCETMSYETERFVHKQKSTFHAHVRLALVIDLSRVTEASKRSKTFTHVSTQREPEKCETGDNRDNF